MSNDNRVSATLPDDAVASIQAHVSAIWQLLPFLKSMTATERRELSRLGDKTIGFDDKSAVYMESNPEFKPPYVDIEEVRRDRALFKQMARVKAQIATLEEAISDTTDMVGADLLSADLAYYNTVREAARRGVAGAKAIYDDLAQRFPQRGRPAAATPPVSTATA